jgi:hypothetical protein
VFFAAYLVVVWPIVHAPFEFGEERYMLPPLFFTLLLAAHGPGELWRIAQSRPMRGRMIDRGAAIALPAMVAVIFAVLVADRLANWPDHYGVSDESALRELRPVVAALDEDALIVTAMARGFDDHESERYIDLIDHRIDLADANSSVAELIGEIDRAIVEGRPAYYLYSRFEEDGDHVGLGEPGLDIYFAGVADTFDTSEVYRAEQQEYRLYHIERH